MQKISKADLIGRGDEVTFLDVEAHKKSRAHLPSAVFHDHGLISLLFNVLANWKRRRVRLPNFDFAGLLLPQESPTLGLRKKRTRPRRVRLTPDQFAKLIEHSTERLRDSLILALDLGMSACDLDRMEVSWLNESTGLIEWTRQKTGQFVAVPPTPRVKRIFEKANGRVTDPTNRRKEFEEARRKAGCPGIQFRDVRKTTVNEAIESQGRIEDGQAIAGHASSRTTVDYYRIKNTWDLNRVVRYIWRRFPTKKKTFSVGLSSGKGKCIKVLT